MGPLSCGSRNYDYVLFEVWAGIVCSLCFDASFTVWWGRSSFKGPCIFKQSDLSAVCLPCKKDEWTVLVGGVQENVLNEVKTRFNNDPISIHYGQKTAIGIDDVAITIDQGPFRTTKA